jgi:hypothetical protein
MRAFAFSGFPVVVEDKLNFDFKCTPNPSSDYLQLTWENSVDGILEIFDMNGKVQYRERLATTLLKTIDTSKWTSANYFIQFKADTGGRIYSKRLVILH